jgi:hypothetical protein
VETGVAGLHAGFADNPLIMAGGEKLVQGKEEVDCQTIQADAAKGSIPGTFTYGPATWI